jgi:hypothetical protein
MHKIGLNTSAYETMLYHLELDGMLLLPGVNAPHLAQG